MAINFPDSPTNGQVALVGGKNYTYNSTKNTWTPTQVTEADLSTVGSTTVVATHDLLPSSPSAGDMALVSSVNKMYVYFLSGWWLMSSLQNASPSGITGNAAIYELATDGTPTTVTLSSSDPEGFPISWSHSVISGSLGGTTVTNVDNVFTITPSTDAADAGTFTLRFAAADGQGGEVGSQSNFTLDFVFIVADSRYTTLLATAVDTSDNNNITDASSNNHTITVSAQAHAGTFSPYRSGGYSWDFEGTGFYTNDAGHGESIEAENNASAFNVGTNDYTVEGWFKERDNETYSTNAYARLFDLGPNDNISLMRNYPNTGGKKLLLKENATVIITSTNDVFDGNWHFIQVIRTGGYTKLYVDGTEEGSIASTTNINAISKIIVGAWSDYSYGFDGQITDFRFSNTARTAAVPTERLTSDSNTKLLVCSKPYLVDESNTATSLILRKSTNGTRDYPNSIAFSPYDYNEYSSTDHGGSINFDGSGDHLTIPDHSSLNFASNDWTIECWIYPRTNVGDCGIWHQSASGTDWYSIYLDGAFNLKFVFYNLSNGVEWAGTAASNTAPQNTWTHVALVRQFGTGVYLYANGKLVASDTLDASVTMLDKTYNHVIGYERFVGSGTYFDGFISDFKMDIGTAHYTAEFTPPTAPLSSSSADMHIKGTDASIIDKAQGSNLKLVGNTTGSTSQVKFGGSKSMYFDGTTDYIVSQEPVKLGTQDFTAECWLYYQSGLELMGNRVTNGSGGFSVRITSTSLTVGNSSGSGFGSVFSGTTSSLTNAWHHIAVSRSSGVTKIYVDGTSIASHSSSIDFSLSNPFVIGYAYTNGSGADSIQGYIQDFRITNGLARYTTNFTPPTASLEG